MRHRSQRNAQGDWVSRVVPGDRHIPVYAPLAVDYHVTNDTKFAFHMHEDMEIGICMAGRSERHIGGASFVARPGDIWLCGMWEPHAWRNAPGVEGVHFYFSPQGIWSPFRHEITWMSMFIAPLDQRPRTNTPEMREAVVAIGTEMARECQEQRIGWHEVGWAALLRLLVILERGWRPPEGSSSSPRSSPSDVARILPALALVQANLSRHVSASEAATACDLSPSRFRTVFRHVMGISYGRYGVRTRVASAASRLLADDAPVEVIAHQTGFTDRSHLARMFAVFHGCAPSEFRRRNQGAQA